MIAENIQRLREEIAATAISSGRDPSQITLVAVSKTRTADEIREAARAGIVHFGENRVQEACAKIAYVGAEAIWHLVGPLQSNKAKLAAGIFDWIDSVHSKKIANLLSTHAVRLEKKLHSLIQVNISGEKTKSGVSPEEAEELARYAAGLPGIEVRGLMTIGSFDVPPEETRKEFRRMRNIFDRLRESSRDGFSPDVLSMGMSDDFKIAIEEGSTMVRVGSAIFGARGI